MKWVFFVLILLIAPLSLHLEILSATQPDQIDGPKFVRIDGNQVSDNVFPSGENITIVYNTDFESDSMVLIINGSGFSNETLKMMYIRQESGIAEYRFELTLLNYTTFYGYSTIDSELYIEKFDQNQLDIAFHRIWTTDDKYPELVEIEGSNSILRDTRIDYQVPHENVTISYSLTSTGNNFVQLLYGRHQSLVGEFKKDLVLQQESNGVQIFTANLSLNSFRELWFTVRSSNSFEYNRQDPFSYELHRLTNGFNASTSISVFQDEWVITDRITDHDPQWGVQVITFNETGVEDIQVVATKIFSDTEGDINVDLPTKIYLQNSTMVNNSLIKEYFIGLDNYSGIQWQDRIEFEISFEDSSINKTIVDSQTVLVEIEKWGPVVLFENDAIYTRIGEFEVDYVINDNGIPLKKGIIKSVHEQKSLNLNTRKSNISVGNHYGKSTIVLNVTNTNNEWDTDSLSVYYDIIKPVIDNVQITQETDRFRITAIATDNKINDSGIRNIWITIDNARFVVAEDLNSTTYSINEIISLNAGNNSIKVKIVDMAGNEAEFLTNYKVTMHSTSEKSSFPSIITLIPLLLIPILLRRRKAV